MNNKTLILMAAIGLGIYAMAGKSKESEYFVPNMGWVKESQLPALGYQKINGVWYSQQQINSAAQQAGIPAGTNIDPTSQTFNTILTILQAMQGLIPVVQEIVTAANRPQKIQKILDKYTVATSAYYNPNFPYTQTDLQAMTNEQLTQILNTGALGGGSGMAGVYGYKKKA